MLAKVCVQNNFFFYDFSVARVYCLNSSRKVCCPDGAKGTLPIAEKEEGEKLCAEDAPRSLLVETLDNLLKSEEIRRVSDQSTQNNIRGAFQDCRKETRSTTGIVLVGDSR